MGGLHFYVTADTSNFNRKLQDIERRIREFSSNVEEQGMSIDGMFQRIAKAAAAMGAAFSAKEFVQKAVQVRGEFQKLEVAFNTMLGSEQKASALMGQLVETAAITPFGLQDVATGAKRLLAYGLASEKVNDTLIRLGDIAAGLSLPLNDLAYLYGTTMVQGRMYTQDLNQFLGRGIPLTEELAKQFGVTSDKVKDLVTEGKVGFPEVEKAIVSMTSEGGKFGGLMAEQSKTIAGQIGNIKDAIETMFNEIGKQGEGVINAGIAVTSALVENWQKVGEAIGVAATAYGTYKAVVMAAAAAHRYESALIKQAVLEKKLAAAANTALSNSEAVAAAKTKMLALAQQGLVKSLKAVASATLLNHYVLIAAAITGLVYAIYKAATAESAAEKAMKAYNEEKRKAIEAEQKHREEVEKLVSAAEDEAASTGVRRDALLKLEKYYPSIFAKYETEYDMLKNIKKIKEEIAKEDATNSITNIGNELYKVNKEINALEARGKKNAKKWAGDGYRPTGTGNNLLLSVDDKARLQALKTQRDTLQRQQKAKSVEDYFADLTGISNEELQRQVDKRKTILADLKHTGKEWGAVTGEKNGSLNGAFRKGDIEAQKNALERELNRRNQKTDTSQGWVESAKRQYERDLKAYNDFISDRTSKLTQEEFEKRRDELKAALEASKKVYDASKGQTTGTKKDYSDQTADRKKAIKEYEESIIEQNRQAELDIEQQNIENMEDGYEKQRKTIELHYKRLTEENRKRKEQMIKDLADNKVNEWMNANPKATKQQQQDYRYSLLAPDGKNRLTFSDLTAGQQNTLNAYDDIAEELRQKEYREMYQKMLDEYQGYEERRLKIREEFAKKRAALEQTKNVGEDVKASIISGWDEMSASRRQDAWDAYVAKVEASIGQLSKEEKDAIRDVNNEEMEAMQKSSSLLVELFSDASDKSSKKIRELIEQTEKLLKYLKETPDGDITANFGFTAEQLKTLKESPEDIKAITDKVKSLKDQLRDKNPFKSFSESLKEVIKLLKEKRKAQKDGDKDGGSDDELAEKLGKMGKSAVESAKMVGDLAGKLSEMFKAAGNERAAQAAENLQSAMTSVSNIAEGFAKNGLVGGIFAIVGKAASWATKAFSAAAEQAAALKQIMSEITAEQRAYNLALLDESLAMKEAITIFGTMDYEKARNSVDVMRNAWADLRKEIEGTAEQQAAYAKKRFNTPDAIKNLVRAGIYNSDKYSQLKDSYSGLADVYVKTGSKRVGLFRRADTFSSILDVYPELIDEQGKFNSVLAKSIIETRSFSDGSKEALQYMIDLADKAEEAYQEVKDYLTDIFGDLGNSISDALSDAFRNGTDAAEAFGKSVTEMLESLGESMIYSTLFSEIIENASDSMTKAMTDNSLTDEQRFNQYTAILDTMTSSILGKQDEYDALLEKYRKMAEDKGLDLWQGEGSAQSASAKGFEAMSQDTANELNGRFTALQESNEGIKNQMIAAVEASRSLLAVATDGNGLLNSILLQQVTTNGHLEDIAKYVKPMLEVGGKLDKIINNTKNL